MPTFAFPEPPHSITTVILRRWNAPLPNVRLSARVHSFGSTLDARLLSTPGRSTSELLRTL